MAGKVIEFSFKGDSADLEAALRRVQKEGREVGTDLEEGGERGAKGLGKAEAAGKHLAGALKAATVAAAASAVAMAAIVKAAAGLAARGDQIAKMAKAIGGIDAEGLQAIQGALSLGGVEAASTANALQKLNINLGEAAEGAGPAFDALKKLNLTFEELEALRPEDRIALIADRLGGFESNTIRAAIAQDLLGRGAKEVLAAFSEGGDAIRSNMELIRETGILSNEAAAQSELLVDAIDLLNRRAGALRDDALLPLLPVLTSLSDEIRAAIDEIPSEAVTRFGEIFATTLLEVVVPSAILFGREFAKVLVSSEAYIAAVKVALLSFRDLMLDMALVKVPWPLKTLILRTFRKEFGSASEALGGFDDAAAEVGSTLAAIDDAADSLAAAVARAALKIGFAGKAADTATEEIEELEDAIDEAEGAAAKAAVGGFSEFADALTDWDSFERALDEAGDTFSDFADSLTDWESFEVELEIKPRLSPEEKQKAVFAAVEAAGEIAKATTGAMEQAFSIMLEDRIEAVRETSGQIENIERRIAEATTDAERDRLVAQRQMLQRRKADQQDAAMEAWRASKALSISEAAIATALSVIAMLQIGPAGIPFSIAAGITGAASIAAIAAEKPPKFHAGGMIGGQARAHDEINIRARAGEAVLSPQGVAAAGGAGGVHALNAGAGVAGSNVTVFQVGHRAVDAMIHESLRRPGGRLTRELRAVRPRRIGRYNPHGR